VKRLPDESFADYKERRKIDNRESKERCRQAVLVWPSLLLGPAVNKKKRKPTDEPTDNS
jgi:hypothetical protein